MSSVLPAPGPTPAIPLPSPSASSSLAPPPPPDLSAMLTAHAARMQALPDVLHPASAYAVPAGTRAYAERVRAAVADAKHDPSTPAWAKVRALAALGCTRSRRVAIAHGPRKPAVASRTYVLPETEAEALAYEAAAFRARTGREPRAVPRGQRARHADVVRAAPMALLEKVGRWQSHLAEPTQPPAPPPLVSQPTPARSQSLLAFTAEKRTVQAKGKGSRRSSRQPNDGPPRNTPVASGSKRPPLQEHTPPTDPESLMQPVPVVVAAPELLPIRPTSSQLSGLSSPPYTPSKDKSKSKGKARAGPLEPIAEAVPHDDIPSRKKRTRSAEEPAAPTPKHKRAKTTPEPVPMTMGPPAARPPKPCASASTIPGLARTQSPPPPPATIASVARPTTPPPVAPFSPPPAFTQDPALFTPGETSILGGRPPSPSPATSAPGGSLSTPAVDAPAPGTFTQDPGLFAPVETSLLGMRVPAAPMAVDALAADAPAPGTFTQDPGLFAPAETSLLGVRVPSQVAAAPAPGAFTQDPALFAPGHASLLGVRAPSPSPPAPGIAPPAPGTMTSPVLGIMTQDAATQPCVPGPRSFGSLAGGSIPGLGRAGGSVPLMVPSQEQAQVRSAGGTWEPASPAFASLSAHPDSSFTDLYGSPDPVLYAPRALGAVGSGDLYSSQLDPDVDADVGEGSRALERDVEYERWLADVGSSQEVRDAVGP